MRHDSAAYRRFLVSAIATVAVLWGAALLLTACIDPYGLLEWKVSERLNGSKAVLHHEQRMAKAFAIAQFKPQTVILGNSRTGHAIDGFNPALWSLPVPVYNSAFDGAHIVEMDAYLRHAFHVGGVRQAVVGLDFSSFGTFVPQAAYRPAILADEQHSGAWQRSVALLRSYGGMDGLLDAWASWRQRAAPAVWDIKGGRRTDAAFASRLQACGGTRENFRIRESRDIRLSTLATLTAASLESSLQTYREMLRFAYTRHLQLTLFVSPTHARSVVLVEQVGKGSLWAHWKRRLVEINAEEATTAGAAQPFILWDFSGFNAATTERVPESGNTAPMWGYWESSHYRKPLGDRLLNEMFAVGPDVSGTPIGVRLAPSMIERHLLKEAARSAAYQATHADELADLYQAVRDKGRFTGPSGCAVL